MNQYGWSDCPADVRDVVLRFADSLQRFTGPNLIGVYLHGSLAMGCFNPARSDIDVLVVTHDGMDLDTKRRVAQHLLETSNAPFPIEISFLRSHDLNPWHYPTTFDFHYSEDWRKQTTQDLSSGAWLRWNDTYRSDPDLAAHITILLRRGIALVGPPPHTMFPAVPRNDYLDSIWLDIETMEELIDSMVVYGTLNICRVYAYVRDGLVCSKDEGGMWALSSIPPRFHSLITQALQAYRGERTDQDIEHSDAVAFARVTLNEIKRYR